jgi:preprotein translocase subunit YajC
LAQLIVIVAMFALLWLLFIRPQRQRAQAQQQLVSGIEVGDEILTVGGIYGTVLELRDDELVLEIAPGTRVRAARRAVAAVMPDDEEPQALEEARETEPNDDIGR